MTTSLVVLPVGRLVPWRRFGVPCDGAHSSGGAERLRMPVCDGAHPAARGLEPCPAPADRPVVTLANRPAHLPPTKENCIMYRSTAAAASALSAALFVTVFGLSLSAAPAVAYDDDVDVVCFDYHGSGGSETECQTIEQLTAECAVVDPEFTTDVCGGLLENRKPFGLTTSSGTPGKDKEKHRRDNDSGKGGRDHDNNGNGGGGGNSGGGNGGSGNGGSGNGGGSGPNG
jgi:uncharacterized membrane protein YgcG